jgi:hypothetical protein
MRVTFKKFIEANGPIDLSEEIQVIDSMLVNEALLDPVKLFFNDILQIARNIQKSNNEKSELNDKTIRQLYIEEKAKLEGTISNYSPKIKAAFSKFLGKHDIILFAEKVDLKRNNLNRLLAIKLVRAMVFAIGQFKQNTYEALITVMFPAVGAIISAVMAAKDAKSAFSEMANSKNQILQIVRKAKQRQDDDSTIRNV